MKLYNVKLAQDYINGNDIEGYTLDELENDKDFMMLVMRITHDKKIYSFCSDEVKKNYKFIRFIINEFKDDLDFLCSAVDYFLEKNNDAISELEVLITMSKLADKKDDESINKYKFALAAKYRYRIYELKMLQTMYSKENNDGLNMSIFYVIYDDFVGHKEILDYFAKRMLNDILHENRLELIKTMHIRFKSVEELEKFGIRKFIIEFVSYYDDMLADYLKTNIEIIKNAEKEDEIKKEFKNYEKRLNLGKCNLIIEQVGNYIESRIGEPILDTIFYLYYVSKEMGIYTEFFEKYLLNNQICDDITQDLLDNFDEQKFNEILSQSLIDRITLNNIIKIFKQVLKIKTIEELNSFDDEYLNKDGNKIIDIGIKK